MNDTIYTMKPTNSVPNTAMVVNNGSQNPRSVRAIDVGGISLSQVEPIDISKRARPLDRNNIDRLKADISVRGLMQPIGVRATKGDRGGPFQLIFGFHRFVAFCELHDEDEEGRTASASIPAIIFPSSMTENEVVESELVENLLRKELTAAERGQHEARYAAVQKRMGAVATANERRVENGKKGGTAKHHGKSSTSDGVPSASAKKPTVTEKLQEFAPASAHAKPGAKASIDSIKDRFNKTKKAAGIHKDVTLETATPEQLDEIADAAEKNNAKVKAETQERKSKAAIDRSKRKAEAPDSRLEALIRGHVADYGWDVLKKAVQTVWREDHAPEGRVVFATSFGPSGND